MQHLTRILTAFLSASLLLFSGCGKSQRPVDEAIKAGILILGNGAEPQGLDPHLVTGVTENNIITALVEGLISYHPADDNIPEPGVAESWEHDGTATEWTFRLREDALWSNGDPVTAGDFVYSWNRMLSPFFGAKYVDMLYVLDNAEAFHRGRVENFDRVGVKAVDDRTLKIRLIGPTPHFLSMLKHYSWFPVHPPTIEKYGGMNEMASRWTREEYVGNGPFVLAEWSPNRVIRVTRSPTYWDREQVRLNEIQFRPIDNANTEEAAFRNGEIHLTNTVPPAQIEGYRRSRPDLIHFDPYLATAYYRFNITRPPLDDRRVREALAISVNQELIVENITKGGQRPAYAYTPPGINTYEPPRGFDYDPERARRLLAEAGYPNGERFPEMEILFNTSETHRAVAQAVQDMWKSELGIDIKLHNQEWKVYLPSQQNMEYDISRSGWVGDFVDPITFLSMWTTGNGNNNTGWSNPRYDRLIEAVQQEGDPAKRLALLHAAEEIFLADFPIALQYWGTNIYLKDPRVKGWNPKLLDNHPYKYVYFDKET